MTASGLFNSNEDMKAESTWSGVSVDFRVKENGNWIAAGIALNINDSSDFGYIRVCRVSKRLFLQAGWWKYGRYRTFLNTEIKQSINRDCWYTLNIHPTEGKKDWRPWTITLKSRENGNVLLEQGIQNEMPLLGRGVVGLCAWGNDLSFQGLRVEAGAKHVAQGLLKLSPLFSDGMILQRNMNVPVWGVAGPCREVSVKINSQVFSTVSDSSGNWRVNLDPMYASEGIPLLVISEKDTLQIRDVAIGELWLASGQSNMRMKVWQSDMDSLARVLPADPGLRMFIQPEWPSAFPLFESGGTWQHAGSDRMEDWSAVAYSFAMKLRKCLHVPVGIICSYWGGTTAESWLPLKELGKDTLTKPILDDYNISLAALEAGQPVGNVHPWNIPGQRHTPGYLYNGMIHPHIPVAIKGVVWYQGESNAIRAKQYESLFPMLINSWREAWNLPGMPFYFVQLAGYDGKQSGSDIESAWPRLRDAQRMTLQKVAHTGMAVAIDLGHMTNIHPVYKKEVGERLAQLALYDVYHRNEIVRCGPLYQSAVFKRNHAVVNFSETAGGMKTIGGKKLCGFVVAGEDWQFKQARAKIEPGSKSIRVWAHDVKHPVAVRYAWENYPHKANLVNSAGLPAAPFRTDNWSLPTDENR